MAEHTALLDEDERQRAGRFRFDKHRRRFTVRRSLLRRLVGGYLDRQASSIELIYGERGTLALAEISSEAYTEISTAKLFTGNKNWSIPTLSRGRLFVRNDEELICLDLRP